MHLATRLYYKLKPLIPWSVRAGLRRRHAQHIRKKAADIWPILPSSATPPTGWTGWPEGKKFGVILTHDVEGQKGYDRVGHLMEMEKSLGFRSAFNLIPEGPYTVEPELREGLAAEGFELGVHDLHHDGKLYRTREEFQRRAKKINGYLKEWGATGFRSAYMHHNLEWIHDLDIQYDCSTFDTDPFEPQPDGVGTIFPFWVPKNPNRNPDFELPVSLCEPTASAGYVELPYTLVQDSTLMLFLEEDSIDIWKQKVDWIARHGGMVLLNVHPDYVNFDDRLTKDEFPVARYSELLAYIKEKYSGEYWHGLPREIASHAREMQPRHEVRPARRVCMLAYTFYESDGRVMRYAEALVNRGDQVDAIALGNSSPGAPASGELNGVRISHLQKREGLERSKLDYFWRLTRFLVVANLHLIRNQFRLPYDVIHVHNIPDFLVFATWFHKLAGGRVILDIHDVVPELYGNKFDTTEESLVVKCLKLVERVSCKFADHVIIANHLWFDKVTNRSVSPEHCTPFINNVDSRLFQPQKKSQDRQQQQRSGDRQVMIFPGSLQWHQGLDVAIDAMQVLRDELPRLDLHIYGSGTALQTLKQQVTRLGLEERIFFFDGCPLAEIIPLVAAADLGVVPKRSDSFGNEAYSTKIMEFLAVGIPAVVSRTRIDDFYFNDEVVSFFEPQNAADLARAIKRVLEDQPYREKLIKNGLEYAEANSWKTVQKTYLDLVDRLAAA